jgi:hypothetical protein
MKIFFSGDTGLEAVPETLVPKLKPRIMLTFYDIKKNGTKGRLMAYLRRIKKPPVK